MSDAYSESKPIYVSIEEYEKLKAENEALKLELGGAESRMATWISSYQIVLEKLNEAVSALELLTKKVEQYADSGCIDSYYIQDDDECLSDKVDRARETLAKIKEGKIIP